MKAPSKSVLSIVLISSIFTCRLCWGMQEEKEPKIKVPAPRAKIAKPAAQTYSQYFKEKGKTYLEPLKLAEPAEEKAPIYRGLLVFLDDSELKEMSQEKVGAITVDLLTALSQNASPIIASESLVYLVTLKQDLAKKAKLIEETIKWQDWIIKGIEPNLCLLFHKNYLKDLSLAENDIKTQSPGEITITEFKLGLKVNHMTSKQVPQQTPSSQQNSPESFAKSLDKIFCTRTDYLEQSSEEPDIQQPLWSIYLSGHGEMSDEPSARGIIAGMPIDLFRTHVLSFLRDKISTRLLFYVSCYAAGINAEKIYRDTNKLIYDTYPFTIITNALTDAPTERPKKMKLDDFLSEATQADSIDYKYLVSTVSQISVKKAVSKAAASWATIPQIKLPGLEWFSVLADENEIVSIGPMLAMTYKKPILNIDIYFQSKKLRSGSKNIDIISPLNPRALLLYAREIPFELVINSERMEAIISMIPGDAAHKIKKISSSYWNVDDVLNWFIAVRVIDAHKIFSIDEIKGVDKTINEVIISSKKAKDGGYERRASFKINNQFYQQMADYGGFCQEEQRVTFGTPEIDPYLREYYYAMAQYTLSKTKPDSKLPLSITPESITELEKVTSPASRMRHSSDFLRNLQEKQAKAARETWQQPAAEGK